MRTRPPPPPTLGRAPWPHVLSVVLAGGEGRRLWPLTADRAKPAVPIGGRYRLIDFALSNLVNSGLLQVKVLTQYKSDSLNTHIARGWRLPAMLGHYVEVVPAQQRLGKEWFRGSADALRQSIHIIEDEAPDHVIVFGGDHMFKMDVRQMLERHLEMGADVTVATVPVPIGEARAYGIVAVDDAGRLTGFEEKPAEPAPLAGRPGLALASMGIYVFRAAALVAALGGDDADPDVEHDLARDILPPLVAAGRAQSYDFTRNSIPGQPEHERGYWRDVGTTLSYWQANMDLLAVTPTFDLYNPRWPIRTFSPSLPPAKFVFADEANARVGVATDSLVCEGCIISGGRIHRTVLGPASRVNSYARVEESILFDEVEVGRHARLRRVIVDKGVEIPPGAEIGYDLELDARRFTVQDGIVVIPKRARIPARMQVAVPAGRDEVPELEPESARDPG